MKKAKPEIRKKARSQAEKPPPLRLKQRIREALAEPAEDVTLAEFHAIMRAIADVERNEIEPEQLDQLERCFELLHELFPNQPGAVGKWIRTPHPDLDGLTARDVMLAGNCRAILILLENAANGIPG